MESRIALRENINATLWRKNDTAEDLSIAIDQLGVSVRADLGVGKGRMYAECNKMIALSSNFRFL